LLSNLSNQTETNFRIKSYPLKSQSVTSATSVDWSGIYTTPVKDQGYCGSCWAFSAVEQVESDTMRTSGNTFILSPEQVTDCAYKAGCQGGATEKAYKYIQDAGGLQSNDDYPYTASTYAGKSGDCVDTTNGKSALVTVTKFHEIVGMLYI